MEFITQYGYLAIVLLLLFCYIALRAFLKLPSLGSRKQLVVFFSLTYITTFLWDNIAVFMGHWEYKNMLGIYLGYSPVENILFAIAFPLSVITLYQVVNRATKSSL